MHGSFILSHQVPEDWRAQADIFGEIFSVFLVIGTLVGVVVVGYTLYHAYRARDTGEPTDDGFEPPVLGELPRGQSGSKSKKLFVSFGISAVIVISLVTYSYFLFQYVETGPTEAVSGEAATGLDVVSAQQNASSGPNAAATSQMEVEVIGIQFAWQFVYPNGVETTNQLRVPRGELIRLRVTSDDVWHNFGVPGLRVKADSIPGQYQETWFIADETGTYTANCYELCGRGHSNMNGEVVIMENEEFYEWYEAEAADESGDDGSGNAAGSENGNVDATGNGNATENVTGGDAGSTATTTGNASDAATASGNLAAPTAVIAG